MSVALIDGDVVAIRASLAGQEDFGDGDSFTDPQKAFNRADRIIADWLRQSRTQIPYVCLSPRESKSTFRYTLFPDYKSNRKGVSKPELYWDVIAYLEENYKIVRIPQLEADDILGIYATSPKLKGAVAVSIDKDVLTIPAKVCLIGRGNRPFRNAKLTSDYNWMIQTMTGDTVDGYKGVPGVGPKTAEKVLEGGAGLDYWWEKVVEIAEKKGIEYDDLIVQARLARILRREDYDPEKKAIRLWHPTHPEWMPLEG